MNSENLFSQKVNITNVGNCETERIGNSMHAVRFGNIEYQMVDGVCDTVTGTYVIPTVNTADKLVSHLM